MEFLQAVPELQGRKPDKLPRDARQKFSALYTRLSEIDERGDKSR